MLSSETKPKRRNRLRNTLFWQILLRQLMKPFLPLPWQACSLWADTMVLCLASNKKSEIAGQAFKTKHELNIKKIWFKFLPCDKDMKARHVLLSCIVPNNNAIFQPIMVKYETFRSQSQTKILACEGILILWFSSRAYTRL